MRRGGQERYIRLRYWMLRSPAWQSLPGTARALYIDIVERYNGSNNGKITYSVREGAAALRISKSTAKNFIDMLCARGFLVCMKRGAFSLKATREASLWRLTEYDCDVPAAHATKDFMRWQPDPEGKTRFGTANRTVRPQYPYGSATGTVNPENSLNGSATGTVATENRPLTVRSQVHIQIPDTGPPAWRTPALIEVTDPVERALILASTSEQEKKCARLRLVSA